MLVGTAISKDGRHRVLIVGMERGNIDRLLDGKPIDVTPEMHGIPSDMEVVIFFGEDPADLIAKLRAAGIENPIEDRR